MTTKNSRQTKTLEHVTHIQGDIKQVTGTACERAQMLDLLGKDFKAAFMNTFQKATMLTK